MTSDYDEFEDLYNPDRNQYIPDRVAEDYDEYGHTWSYRAEVLLETPIDQTMRAWWSDLK